MGSVAAVEIYFNSFSQGPRVRSDLAKWAGRADTQKGGPFEAAPCHIACYLRPVQMIHSQLINAKGIACRF